MNDAIAFAYALGDQTRWRIAMLIMEKTLCVCELVDALRIPQSTLSGHLATMRGAGLVEVTKTDKWAFYRLAPAMLPLVKAVRDHFADSIRKDATLKADRKLIAARVALRGQTDCKGPRRAIPPKPPKAADPACC
jgi:ArsR family transcriptional regulator